MHTERTSEKMSGEIVYKVAGLPPDAELVGAWLSLPGVGGDGPFLEIFQSTEMHERATPPSISRASDTSVSKFRRSKKR